MLGTEGVILQLLFVVNLFVFTEMSRRVDMEDALHLGLEFSRIVGKSYFIVAGNHEVLYQLVFGFCLEVSLGILFVSGIKTELVNWHILIVE